MTTLNDTLAQADLLHQAGNVTHAEYLYRQVLAADSANLDAWRKLGQCLQLSGRLSEAVMCFQQALVLQPDDLVTYADLGKAHVHAGQYQEAAATFQELLRRDPHNIDAANNLGFILAMQGRAEESAAVFQELVRVHPNNAAFHSNLGNVLAALGRDNEAAACHRRSLEINPDSAATHNNLGTVLFNQDKLDEALHCYEQALRLMPDYAEAHNNTGTILERRGQNDEAIACYHHALKLKPNYAEAFSNLGNVHAHTGRRAEALACYEQALCLDQHYADAHLNKALELLLQGDWLRAWPEYEWRWLTKGFVRYTFSQPRWDGTPMPGRTLLVLAEQGLGDTLQFIRYLALVKQRVGKVVFNCPGPLVKLVANIAGIDHIVAVDSALPPFDAYVPLVSLPGIYRTTPDTAPAPIPYLQAEADLIAHWQRELKLPAGLKVGIAWQGNPKYRYDRHRSIPVAHFGQLAAVKGLQMVSLQKGHGTEQLQSLNFPVHDPQHQLGDALDSFRHLAAIVKNLDLVIACDSAIVHLAGSLGIRAWVALPWDNDWRWLLRREDSPWYPMVRLFRQKSAGDWDEVFQRMAQKLR